MSLKIDRLDLGFSIYTQNAINAILRMTLRHVITESLELSYLCENIAFVLNIK